MMIGSREAACEAACHRPVPFFCYFETKPVGAHVISSLPCFCHFCYHLLARTSLSQALLATALGLPCTYFRRLIQNNAATSVLHFTPGQDQGAAPQV
jgi:hypothetical protein